MNCTGFATDCIYDIVAHTLFLQNVRNGRTYGRPYQGILSTNLLAYTDLSDVLEICNKRKNKFFWFIFYKIICIFDSTSSSY